MNTISSNHPASVVCVREHCMGAKRVTNDNDSQWQRSILIHPSIHIMQMHAM